MFRKGQTLWLAAAIGIGAAGTATGQEAAMTDIQRPEATIRTRADTSGAVLSFIGTMVDEAMALERPGHYLEAAGLYEAAAWMLLPSDPKALRYRTRAAHLCYHAGDLDRSLATFEEVGRQATEAGNPEEAAQAYQRAMHIALELGDKPKAFTFYLKSLPEEERDKLLERRKRRQ